MAVALPELNLQCGRCHENPRLQIENGCKRDSPVPDRWQIGEYTFQRCPGSIVTRQSYEYIAAYNWREKGFLPNPGGWMEQPAKFVEAMGIIEREITRESKERMEEVNRRGRNA